MSRAVDLFNLFLPSESIRAGGAPVPIPVSVPGAYDPHEDKEAILCIADLEQAESRKGCAS